MPLFCHGVVFSSALAKKSIYLPKFGEAFLQNQDGKNDAVTSKIYNANTDEARTAAGAEGAAAAGACRFQDAGRATTCDCHERTFCYLGISSTGP